MDLDLSHTVSAAQAFAEDVTSSCGARQRSLEGISVLIRGAANSVRSTMHLTDSLLLMHRIGAVNNHVYVPSTSVHNNSLLRLNKLAGRLSRLLLSISNLRNEAQCKNKAVAYLPFKHNLKPDVSVFDQT